MNKQGIAGQPLEEGRQRFAVTLSKKDNEIKQ